MTHDWFEHLLTHPALFPPAQRRENGSDQILALLRELAASERLPTPELARRQRKMLHLLARHSAAQSPYFAARLDNAHLTPDTLAEEGGLAKLPPFTRRDLVHAGDTLFCRTIPPSHGHLTPSTTSGSTGEPVTIRRTALCHLHWLAHTLREHLWHQRDFTGRLAVLRANIATPIDAPDWGPPCTLLFRTGPASAMPPATSIQDLRTWLTRFDPHHLLILPSTLQGLLTELEQTTPHLSGLRENHPIGNNPDLGPWTLDPSSVRENRTLSKTDPPTPDSHPLPPAPCSLPFPSLLTIRTISETVHPSLRETAHRLLHLPIHDSYTSQEGGIIATQCPGHDHYHVAEPILLEILDENDQPCAPGQIGRIVLTDLVNFATPLIRYEIGDYAEAGHPCPCGRGLPVIRRFLGRERNLLLLPDGTRYWPTVGYHRYPEVHPIRQFQFIQQDRHTILARLSTPTLPTDPAIEHQLTQIIQQALHHPFQIRYEWQTTPLARPPNGKFEEFICCVESDPGNALFA